MSANPISIKSIQLYPIKGMGGIPLKHTKALKEGIEWDRHWMLINERGEFITQREQRNLVFFKTELLEDGIQVSYENDSLRIPFKSMLSESCEVQIWEHTLKANVWDKRFSAWFSDRLDKNVQLVSLNKDHARIKKIIVEPSEIPIRFSDGYPYTILGTASINSLNDKLENKIDASRFRSTILLETQTPHEEDNWTDFKLGGLAFRMVKPCTRCVVTTIDQKTGTASKEPLKTLNNYRKVGNHILFSMNAICLEEGNLSVGDTLEI